MTPAVKRLIGWGVASVVTATAGIVASWEGKENKAYIDPVGIPTLCFGRTRDVELGMTATDEDCYRWLEEDVAEHYEGVKKCIHKPLALHETAAVVSLAFNVGVPKFCGSTLARQINAGAPPEVFCQQFDRWVYAGGEKLRGLERRRAEEKALCLGQSRWLVKPTTLLTFIID